MIRNFPQIFFYTTLLVVAPALGLSAKTIVHDYHPAKALEKVGRDLESKAQARMLSGYYRSESQSYLSLPEWYLVFSADEYAAYIQTHRPSTFPYFQAIQQYWSIYKRVLEYTWPQFSLDLAYHLKIIVVGVGFSAEYFLKGLYESTIGRLSEILVGSRIWSAKTSDDRFMQQAAWEYAQYLHNHPWYNFDFLKKLNEFWSPNRFEGSFLRRWERKLIMTSEYAGKAAVAGLIKFAVNRLDLKPITRTQFWVRGPWEIAIKKNQKLKLQRRLLDGAVLSTERGEAFGNAALSLIGAECKLVEVAGNRSLLISVIAPKRWSADSALISVVGKWPLLTDLNHQRVVFSVGVDRLDQIIPKFVPFQASLEHLYDF